MAPVRTGLDERLEQLQSQLVDDLDEVRRIYALSIASLVKLDVGNVDEVIKARDQARKISWERTGDILLVLSLNQPMMGDLRMISTILRGADTVERANRHARDISMISQYLVDEVDIGRIPETLSDLIQKMADSLDRVIHVIAESVNDGTETDIEDLSGRWDDISQIWESCQEVISSTPGKDIGSKTGRLNLFKAISRIERTGYNFIRFASYWHHALKNEWISIGKQ